MKKEHKIQSLLINIFIINFGLLINGLGLALLYSVEMGTSPMGTFSDGLHTILSITQGQASILANAIFLFLILIFKRKYINIGTLFCTFMIGIYLDFSTQIISPFDLLNLQIPFKLGVSFIGTLLMGIGLGIYVAVNMGFGPLEAIVDIIYHKFNIQYKTAKIIFDACLGILGIIFGGAIGGGTVISIFFTGVFMQRSIKLTKIFLNKINIK
jgi:uncharacterized membrane protein YczE